MTFLPIEQKRIGKGLPGKIDPKSSVSARPGSVEPASERHHIVRRSFLGGDFELVEIDGKPVANVVWLSHNDHALLTENKAKIIWDDAEPTGWVWLQRKGQGTQAYWLNEGPLEVPRPYSGEGVCPTCNRKLPIQKEKMEPKRNRSVVSIKVPKDSREDGIDVVRELMSACAEKLGKIDEPAYYTLVMVLAFFLQNYERNIDG